MLSLFLLGSASLSNAVVTPIRRAPSQPSSYKYAEDDAPMDFLCPAINLKFVEGDPDESTHWLVRATNVSESVLQCKYLDNGVCSYARSDGSLHQGPEAVGLCPPSIDPALNFESEFDCDELNLLHSQLIGTSVTPAGNLVCAYADNGLCTYSEGRRQLNLLGYCPPTVASSTVCLPTPAQLLVCPSTDNNHVTLAIGLPSTADPTTFDCVYNDGEMCAYALSDGHLKKGSSACAPSIAGTAGGSYSHGTSASSAPNTQPSYGYGDIGVGKAAALDTQGGSSRLASSANDSNSNGKASSAPQPAVIALLALNGFLVLAALVILGLYIASCRRGATKPKVRYDVAGGASVPLTYESGEVERYSD